MFQIQGFSSCSNNYPRASKPFSPNACYQPPRNTTTLITSQFWEASRPWTIVHFVLRRSSEGFACISAVCKTPSFILEQFAKWTLLHFGINICVWSQLHEWWTDLFCTCSWFSFRRWGTSVHQNMCSPYSLNDLVLYWNLRFAWSWSFFLETYIACVELSEPSCIDIWATKGGDLGSGLQKRSMYQSGVKGVRGDSSDKSSSSSSSISEIFSVHPSLENLNFLSLIFQASKNPLAFAAYKQSP